MVSNNIGDWGPVKGRPVEVYISPFSALLGMVKWLIIAVGFILLKENRTGKALWLLMPMVIALAIWWIYLKIVSLGQSGTYFDIIVNSTVISFVFCWLLSEKLAKVHRFLVFILTVIIFIAFGVLEIMSFGDMEAELFIVYLIAFGVVLSGIIVTRWMCRRRFRPIKFVILTFVNMILISGIFVVSAFVIQAMANSQQIDDYIWQVLLMALIFGFACFVLCLPFVIFLINNKFWNCRFMELFRYSDNLNSEAVLDTISQISEESTG